MAGVEFIRGDEGRDDLLGRHAVAQVIHPAGHLGRIGAAAKEVLVVRRHDPAFVFHAGDDSLRCAGRGGVRDGDVAGRRIEGDLHQFR